MILEGRADLAADALWMAREAWGRAGYDIRSLGLNGRPRYIHVKATRLGALTPFYVASADPCTPVTDGVPVTHRPWTAGMSLL